MNRDSFLRFLSSEYPEIAAGLHCPIFCRVVKTPADVSGNAARKSPKYAVSVRVLTPALQINEAIPQLDDVPVALFAAGADRGAAALPNVGSTAILSFAYGSPDLPFILPCALPFNLSLPPVTGTGYTVQQDSETYLKMTAGKINALAAEITHTADKIHLGTDSDNFLKLVSDFMAEVSSAFSAIAAHTHPYVNVAAPAVTSPSPDCAPVAGNGTNVSTLKGTLDGFTL